MATTIRNDQVNAEGSNDPNEIVKLDSSGRLPAVDGSQLTNIPASVLTGDLPAVISDQYMSSTTVIPTNRVGELNFLPLDVDGDFTGAAVAFTQGTGFMYSERDGSLIGIRPGSNGNISRYFLMYATDGLYQNVVLSDIEYRPPFLASNEVVEGVINCNSFSKGFQARIKNLDTSAKKLYWIEINGTMDPSFHTFIDITGTNLDNGAFDNNWAVERVHELDMWLTLQVSATGVNTLTVLDDNLGIVNSFPIANPHVTGSDFNYLNYGGTHAATSAQTVHRNIANIQYVMASANDIRISFFGGLRVVYGTVPLLRDGGFRATVTYNIFTDSFTRFDPTPWTFDPNVTTQAAPITDVGYYGFFRQNGTQLLPNGDIVALTIAPDDPTRFVVATQSSGETWQSHVEGWGHTPHKIRNEYSISPTDAAVLGKAIYNAMWIGHNTILTNSAAKLYTDTVVTNRIAKNTIPGYTTTTIHDGVDTALLPPSSTVVDAQFGGIAEMLNLSTIIRSDGTYDARYFDGGTFTYSYFDGDAGTYSFTAEKVIPSNWETQCSNIITVANPTAAGFGFNYRLQYLANDVFTLTYVYYNSTTFEARHGLVTLKLSGVTFTTVTHQPDISIIPSSTGLQNAYNRAGYGILDDASNNKIYAIIWSPFNTTPGGNNSATWVVDVNRTTGALNANTPNLMYVPTWYTGDTGIHPEFGPYVCNNFFFERSGADMNHVTNATVGAVARCKAIFDDLLVTPTNFNDHLFIITIQSPVGFIVYVSEFPVFMSGQTFTIPTQAIDLDVLFVDPSNKTYNVYVELSAGSATLLFDENVIPDSNTIVRIGTVETGPVGVTNINVNKVSSINNINIDNFAPKTFYLEVLANGTGSFLPAGWTSIKTATGRYVITHNLNNPRLGFAVNATSAAGIFAVTGTSNNSFTLEWTVGGVATDVDFVGRILQ